MVAVAALPLQQGGASAAPPAEAIRAMVFGGLLSVPSLCARVGTAGARLGKGGLLWARITEQGAALAALTATQVSFVDPDVALCIGANLLSLIPTSPPPTPPQLLGLALLLDALLKMQPTASSSGAGTSGRGGVDEGAGGPRPAESVARVRSPSSVVVSGVRQL